MLEPGGDIIVGLIDPEGALGKAYEAKKSESRFYRDATFHSVEQVRDDLQKAGFEDFAYTQALLPGDVAEGDAPVVKAGYGEGSFVVIRGRKK